MIKYLIHRPTSVILVFLALFILGIITYMNLPVSLLPDIAIPEITVQVSGQNASARELENTVVRPLRQQLMQVGKLRDIRSETRDGNSVVYSSFEYGAAPVYQRFRLAIGKTLGNRDYRRNVDGNAGEFVCGAADLLVDLSERRTKREE